MPIERQPGLAQFMPLDPRLATCRRLYKHRIAELDDVLSRHEHAGPPAEAEFLLSHPSKTQCPSELPIDSVTGAAQLAKGVSAVAREDLDRNAGEDLPVLNIVPLPRTRVEASQKRDPKTAERGRILVMDEHPMVEDWIGTLIHQEADLVFAGHASELSEAANLVARGRPNLVLLETGKDPANGLAILRALREEFPDLRLLVFSSCNEIAHSVEVLRAGARGFVSKAATGADLLRAIREVMADGVYLSRKMLAELAQANPEPRPARAGPGALLSRRELEVFVFIGEGLRPTEIAQKISLSVKTVESYLSRIREKLCLRDARALFQDAVKWSKQQGAAVEK